MNHDLPSSNVSAHAAIAGLEKPIAQLQAVGRYFFQRGWSVGTSSNYSVVVQQKPLQLLVTASGMDKGDLQRADFVRVNYDGVQVDAEGQPTTDQPRSSAETALHVILARQAEVGSVLHTHSVWGTLISDIFGDAGQLEIEDYEMLKGLSGIKTHRHTEVVPIYENTQDIAKLAEKVDRRLQAESEPPIHGFLIRNHGLYTWGKDVKEAKRHIEIFEFLFEVLGRRMTLPKKAPTAE